MFMITKTGAAEQQLDTAIRLFFESRDRLSSYALAAASREVTDDVIQSRHRHSELYQRELARVGDPQKVRLSYWEEINNLIDKDKFDKNFKDKLGMNFVRFHNRWQNFLKHADEDPDAEIEPFTTKHLALVILTAMNNYFLLTQDLTFEMKTFFVWIAVAEPQLLKFAPEDVMSNNSIAEMRSFISGDPYDRDTLENIFTAMRL
jgi:hypothetical protein